MSTGGGGALKNSLTGKIGKNIFLYGARSIALGTPMSMLQGRLDTALTKTMSTLCHICHIDQIKANRATGNTSNKAYNCLTIKNYTHETSQLPS